jgi:hypothetical protein
MMQSDSVKKDGAMMKDDEKMKSDGMKSDAMKTGASTM